MSAHLAIAAAVLCCVACGNGGHSPKPNEPMSRSETETRAPANRPGRQSGADQNEGAPVSPQSIAIRESAPPVELIFDFAKNLDRAHLRSGGLLVDFGTPGRHKYTLGDWRSGWRGNFADGDATFSYMASDTARILFDASEDGERVGSIAFRARAVGSGGVRVYLNGKYAGKVDFPANAFSHAAVEVKDGLVMGQNEIMLRANGRKLAHDGMLAALAVDYVRITPAAEATGPAAASLEALRFPDNKGGPDGLLLAAPDSLSFHLGAPQRAILTGRARSRQAGEETRLEVAVSADNAPKRSYAVEMKDQSARLDFSLQEYAGQAVSIGLSASGGEVVLSGAGIAVEPARGPKASGNPRAKNMVLIVIDTLRADRLSTYNQTTRVRAEYLERLGAESMVFERALAPENWTKPSVASLLSGLYPTSHQTKDDVSKVPNTVLLASEHFQKLGFTTAAFVANGYVSGKFGFEKGWDTWKNYVREGKPNRARFVVDDVTAWLEARPPDKPFFLYVHTIDPHVPYIPPKEYWERYDDGAYNGPVKPRDTAKLLERVKCGAVRLSERDKVRLEALYDGEISYHDDQLVRLHDALSKMGLLDDTLLVVTSDHGEEFFEHGLVGHGHSLYEELLHVPLIVRLPGAVSGRGARSSAEVGLADVLPSSCDILGVECPSHIEGRSFLPLLAGKAGADAWSVSFSEFLNGQRAARMGRLKVIYKGFAPQLFDLETDPKETTDLSAEAPIALSVLRDALGLHLGGLGPGDGSDATRPSHRKEKVVIDSATRRQLEALGYMVKDGAATPDTD